MPCTTFTPLDELSSTRRKEEQLEYTLPDYATVEVWSDVSMWRIVSTDGVNKLMCVFGPWCPSVVGATKEWHKIMETVIGQQLGGPEIECRRRYAIPDAPKPTVQEMHETYRKIAGETKEQGHCPLPNGFTLYWARNRAGGRTYQCDELGANVWDTAITDSSTLLVAIAKEGELLMIERQEKRNAKMDATIAKAVKEANAWSRDRMIEKDQFFAEEEMLEDQSSNQLTSATFAIAVGLSLALILGALIYVWRMRQ